MWRNWEEEEKAGGEGCLGDRSDGVVRALEDADYEGKFLLCGNVEKDGDDGELFEFSSTKWLQLAWRTFDMRVSHTFFGFPA